jgi:hypothetical protein
MGLILIEHVLVSYMLFDRLSLWLWFKECKNDVINYYKLFKMVIVSGMEFLLHPFSTHPRNTLSPRYINVVTTRYNQRNSWKNALATTKMCIK